jgi:hypothetical protein
LRGGVLGQSEQRQHHRPMTSESFQFHHKQHSCTRHPCAHGQPERFAQGPVRTRRCLVETALCVCLSNAKRHKLIISPLHPHSAHPFLSFTGTKGTMATNPTTTPDYEEEKRK